MGDLVGDLEGAARSKVDAMAGLHMLALVSVAVLGALHVLDSAAVVAALGMVLHGFREAHRRPTPPSAAASDREASPAAAPSPAPPPAASPRGAVRGMRRLAWVAVVVAVAGLASCASTGTPQPEGAGPFIAKVRGWTRVVCGTLDRIADTAEQWAQGSGGELLPARDAGADAEDAGDAR